MTTRILLLSDTHLRTGASLPTSVLELADVADHVIHAGDLVELDVLDTLEALAPVTAVHGNVCSGAVAARLPERATVTVAGVHVGVVHDPGAAQGRSERLRQWFPSCGVVVYGHTHAPVVDRSIPGLVIVNPGSPTQRRRAPAHTVAWMEIDADGTVEVELVELPNAVGGGTPT